VAPESQLYLRQLLSGRDFATDDEVARQMVNFAYLVGDRASGEALIVDPAYAVADHVGGSLMGHPIEGIAALLADHQVPIHANQHEVDLIRRQTGCGVSDLVGHASGDVVTVGSIEVELLHTPGHTPGSQCFLVDGLLVSGDTLFLDGCGRTDLPGSDVEAMYESLQHLASLPDDTAVLPGHRYSVPSSATMEAVRSMNVVYRPQTKQAWLTMFGAA
jgi:glyoxylase-like metal-dependent hydrolase (beta-lactamase superfamily II)